MNVFFHTKFKSDFRGAKIITFAETTKQSLNKIFRRIPLSVNMLDAIKLNTGFVASFYPISIQNSITEAKAVKCRSFACA